MAFTLTRDLEKNTNRDRKSVFNDSLLKTSPLGLMVQGARKLLLVVGESRVYPDGGEQGTMNSVASESSQETRNATSRYSSSGVVEMG